MLAPTGSRSSFGWRKAIRFTKHGQAVWTGPVNEFIRFESQSGWDMPNPTFTPDGNMDPSNQDTGGEVTGRIYTPKLSFEPDANTMAPILADHCGSDPIITTPAGGTTSRQLLIYPWQFGDPTPATFRDAGIAEVYDGQQCRLVEGARLQDVSVKINQGKVKVELGYLACSTTLESDATVSAVGTYTGKPILKGRRKSALAGLTIGMKITAVAGSPFDGTLKLTSDGTYTGTYTHQFKFDRWYRAVDHLGALMGENIFTDLWFCVPSSGGTAVAVNDTFTFTDTRTPATVSYSQLLPFQHGGFEMTVEGETEYFHSAEIKISRGLKANIVSGLLDALSIQENGKWKVALTLDRDRNDTSFVTRFEADTVFAAVAKMRGLPIEGSILHEWDINLNGKVTKVTRDVTTENTLQEKIEVAGLRSGSIDIFSHRLICTRLAA